MRKWRGGYFKLAEETISEHQQGSGLKIMDQRFPLIFRKFWPKFGGGGSNSSDLDYNFLIFSTNLGGPKNFFYLKSLILSLERSPRSSKFIPSKTKNIPLRTPDFIFAIKKTSIASNVSKLKIWFKSQIICTNGCISESAYNTCTEYVVIVKANLNSTLNKGSLSR